MRLPKLRYGFRLAGLARRVALLAMAMLAASAAAPFTTAQALPLAPGDILIAQLDRVIKVDPSTGAQTLVSQGGLLTEPLGVTADRHGNVFVVDSDRVIGIAPDGGQSLISSGGLLSSSGDIISDGSGGLLLPSEAPCCTIFSSKSIIWVDAVSGTQVQVLAEFPVNGIGLGLISPFQIELDSLGSILALDLNLGGSFGGVARIDPSTGAVFDLILSGGPYIWPSDIAVAENDDIIVNYLNDSTGERELLVYDAAGVFQEVLATTHSYAHILFDPSGSLIGVSGNEIFLISGGESLLSSGGFLADGVRDIATVPIPEPTTALLLATGLAGLAAAGRRHSRR